MSPLAYAWLIPLVPTLTFVVNILVGHRLGKRGGAYLSIAGMGVSLLLAIAVLAQVYGAAPRWDTGAVVHIIEAEEARDALVLELRAASQSGAVAQVPLLVARVAELEAELHRLEHDALLVPAAPDFPFVNEFPWLSLPQGEGIPFGFLLDPFAALMVFMVTLVSLLIHLFSMEYMAGEERYPTFFAYISLFTAAMLGMLMSRNLFHVLLFWEVMGVMSYLLIGFFYKRITAQQAMKKAFLVTKIGDIAFIAGLALLYAQTGTLDLLRMEEALPLLAGSSIAFIIGFLLFLGAMGKSAQFPLHVWLLDAMEGPTPVSAMIHAATMVAAGVYLMARVYGLLELSNVLPIIAIIGAITSLFASTLACAYADIKKILAWSTVSQLGLMFLALGEWGWTAAVFHLLTHAFFKALLFLCAGSMIHASHTQDIFKMNKLRLRMPVTHVTFIIGGLSLAGMAPSAGFWSKDEILIAAEHAVAGNLYYLPLLLIAYATSFLTAFYITRAYIIAFEQPATPSPWEAAAWNQEPLEELGLREVLPVEAHTEEAATEAHESGWAIGTALSILAGGTIILGFLGSPLLNYRIQTFVYHGSAPHIVPFSDGWLEMLIGTLLAVSGITLATMLYWTGGLKLKAPEDFTRFLQKRFYMDHALYHFVARPLTRGAQPAAFVDRRLLDGAIDLAAWAVLILGDALRRVQTGRLEHYAWTLAAGALVLVVAISLRGLL